MNFIDALKSGRPFRREGWADWYDRDEVQNLEADDMLQEDWEVLEAEVTLTKAQVDAHLQNAQKGLTSTPELEEFQKRLRKYLGLGGVG